MADIAMNIIQDKANVLTKMVDKNVHKQTPIHTSQKHTKSVTTPNQPLVLPQ